MRIITGTARGTKLEAPDGLNTRPTAERTKEAVFSAVQFSIEGRNILDLFAGSGQMGLEALSRGARKCVSVDCDRKACEIIRRNAAKTHLEENIRILNGDVIQSLGKLKGEKFSLCFMDPPYASGLIPEVLRRLAVYGLLEPTAYVICEAPSEEAVFGEGDEVRHYYTVYRQYRYGVAHVVILRPCAEENS